MKLILLFSLIVWGLGDLCAQIKEGSVADKKKNFKSIQGVQVQNQNVPSATTKTLRYYIPSPFKGNDYLILTLHNSIPLTNVDSKDEQKAFSDQLNLQDGGFINIKAAYLKEILLPKQKGMLEVQGGEIKINGGVKLLDSYGSALLDELIPIAQLEAGGQYVFPFFNRKADKSNSNDVLDSWFGGGSIRVSTFGMFVLKDEADIYFSGYQTEKGVIPPPWIMGINIEANFIFGDLFINTAYNLSTLDYYTNQPKFRFTVGILNNFHKKD